MDTPFGPARQTVAMTIAGAWPPKVGLIERLRSSIVRGKRSHRARNPEKFKSNAKVNLGVAPKVTKEWRKSNSKVTKTRESYFLVIFLLTFSLLFRCFLISQGFGLCGTFAPQNSSKTFEAGFFLQSEIHFQENLSGRI